MEYDEVSKAILRKMFYDTRIGGRHLSLEDLQRGFPSHEKGNVKNRLKKLIKENLILHHPAGYGMQYHLNPQRTEEISKIIQDEEND